MKETSLPDLKETAEYIERGWALESHRARF